MTADALLQILSACHLNESPEMYRYINPLKPAGYVTYQQFNIQLL